MWSRKAVGHEVSLLSLAEEHPGGQGLSDASGPEPVCIDGRPPQHACALPSTIS